MRLVFAGSPDVAVPTLSALAESSHDVVAVITRADSPQGRKRVLTPTPVAVEAERQSIPLIKTNRLDADVTAQVEALSPDLGVIVAYGGLVREPLLSLPRLGWINLHFSLLPRWRGAAPVQHSIIAGDEITGATVFQLVAQLDAGDIFGHLTHRVGTHSTSGEVLNDLAVSGAPLVHDVVDALESGEARAEPQSGDVTLAPKLTLGDARIDFANDDRVVYARIRGVTPEPGAFADLEDTRVKLIECAPTHDVAPLAPGVVEQAAGRVVVGTARAPLELVTVQPAGKSRMRALDWLRGRQGRPTVFTTGDATGESR